jgi:hypothetical protein
MVRDYDDDVGHDSKFEMMMMMTMMMMTTTWMLVDSIRILRMNEKDVFVVFDR